MLKTVEARNSKSEVKIDVSSIQGEPGTGYEGPLVDGREVAFHCDDCYYFNKSDSSCGEKNMKKASKRPRTKTGRVKVDAHGCCEYIKRVAGQGSESSSSSSSSSSEEE